MLRQEDGWPNKFPLPHNYSLCSKNQSRSRREKGDKA